MGSALQAIRECVAAMPVGGFIRSTDLVGAARSRAVVEATLDRLCESESLRLVHRGLYYKGERTRFGVTRPAATTVAMEVLRRLDLDAGAGPAGMSAARALGLTGQVPAFFEMAVCGRPPAPVTGVRFVSRAPAARSGLRPLEVGVLEVLRTWPRYCERDWSEFVGIVATLARQGEVSPVAIHAAAGREYHRQPRALARQLAADLAARSECDGAKGLIGARRSAPTSTVRRGPGWTGSGPTA